MSNREAVYEAAKDEADAKRVIPFRQLVARDDHSPHVALYQGTGSQSVSIAHLRYKEATTVKRTVQEYVLTLHLTPGRLEVDLAGHKRRLSTYEPGLLTLHLQTALTCPKDMIPAPRWQYQYLRR